MAKQIDNDGLDISQEERLEILSTYPLHYIGPTWKQNEDGTWAFPERTLGPQVAGWAFRFLRALGGDENDGFVLTDEQFRFMCWWYALDEHGEFIYSRGVLQRVKGWGKDPVAAVLCLAEAMGPVRFSHWITDEEGNKVPVGKQHPDPEVQVVAVSEQQTRNLTAVFNSLTTPHLEETYGFQARSDISRARGRRAEIRAAASSFRSIEGNRTTFAVLDEALDLDTPTPTPRGYRRFGDLQTGDWVIGSDGKPVRIKAVKPVQTGRKCFQVRYATGESIVASDGHLWLCKIGTNGAASVRKTSEMTDHEDDVFIPAPPTVDPGTSFEYKRMSELDLAAKLPIGVALLPLSERATILRAAWQFYGHVNKRGEVIYQLRTKGRQAAVLGLLRSFGVVRITSASGTSITCQPHFNVTTSTEPPHKLWKQPEWIAVRISEVPSRPVRCISVEADDQLFLAGLSHFVTHNTQHWVPAKQGHELYMTIANNLNKTGGRSLAITNAPRPGEMSVAESDRLRMEQQASGQTTASSMLYDSIEAHPDTPLDDEKVIRVIFPRLRGDSSWLRTKNVLNALQDTTISIAQLRRMWLNQVVTSDDALFTVGELSSVMTESRLKRGDEIIMGFDGGWSDDSTALVGLRIKDMSFHLLGLWERPVARTKWKVDPDAVEGRISRCFDHYKVLGMFCDTAHWESRIASWEKEWASKVRIRLEREKPFAFHMSGKKAATCKAVEMLVSSVRDQKVLISDQEPAMVAHFQNAIARETLQGLSFSKETPDSPRKVDLFAACVLAMACWDHGRTTGAFKRGGNIRIQGGLAG